MNAEQSFWIFYNISQKIQNQALASKDALQFIFQLKESEYRNYLLWTQGWENWMMLSDFIRTIQTNKMTLQQFFLSYPRLPKLEELDETLKTITITLELKEEITPTKTPTVSGSTPVFSEIKDQTGSLSLVGQSDFHPDELNGELSSSQNPLKKESSSEKRSAPRHDYRLEILLMSPDKSFRTYTKNISLSGAYLEDPVPKAIFNSTFEVVVVNRVDHKKVLLKGRTLGDLSDLRRLKFVDMDPRCKEDLKRCLDQYKESTSLLKKTTVS